jgi:hypothetical protein
MKNVLVLKQDRPIRPIGKSIEELRVKSQVVSWEQIETWVHNTRKDGWLRGRGDTVVVFRVHVVSQGWTPILELAIDVAGVEEKWGRIEILAKKATGATVGQVVDELIAMGDYFWRLPTPKD